MSPLFWFSVLNVNLKNSKRVIKMLEFILLLNDLTELVEFLPGPIHVTHGEKNHCCSPATKVRHYPRNHALPKVHCSVLFLTAAKEEKGNPRRLSVPALIAVSGGQSGRDFNPRYWKSHWFWGMCLPGSWLCIDADRLLPNTWFPRNDCNKCRLSDCWVIYFLEVSLFSKLKGRCVGCVGCVFPVSHPPTCPTPVTPSGTGGLLPHDLSTQREAWSHMTGDFFSGVRAN